MMEVSEVERVRPVAVVQAPYISEDEDDELQVEAVDMVDDVLKMAGQGVSNDTRHHR